LMSVHCDPPRAVHSGLITMSGNAPHQGGATPMLAAAAFAVKVQDTSTPEQRACSTAIDHALTLFWGLVERLHAAADARQPLHHVEEVIFRQLLAMGQDFLRAFLAQAGDGDVGPTLTSPGESPGEPPQILPRLDSPRSRSYLSVFGEVAIQRVGYGHDRLEAAPLDARLHLPRRQYSYLLQQWLGAFVIDDAHAEAVKKLQTILGLSIPVKASEDLNREQASDVEPFQDSLPVPESSQEGSIVVVTADCKGVPLVRSALADAEPETATPAVTSRPSPHHRRGKGEKANTKRMAAVGAVYTIEPFVRKADEVIDELQRKKAARRRPRPQHKRLRADLLLGKVSLFLWLADELCHRNPAGIKPVVFLSDGERALHDRQGDYLPEGVTCILDLLHVLERLWKVAWCLFEEGKQKAEAQRWVEDRLRMLLDGKVGYVIGGLRQTMTKRKLKGSHRKTVQEVIGYFDRNRSRMRYDEYLAAGYPIGSGVIEGACRHLVKDRLERAGMRWTPDGAQAMMDLRATYLNGEWNAFWNYHVEQEDDRLYWKLRMTG
jgi:hypothetical protein